jgi:type I restriction enzyme M protein
LEIKLDRKLQGNATMINFQGKANFIWSVADLLRSDDKQSDYGKVILPLIILCRLNCVLEFTKKQVLEKLPTIMAQNIAPNQN